MSAAEKSSHYLLSETQICNPRQLVAEIATFFAKQHKNVVIIMKAPKISTSEAIENFKTLTSNEHRYIKFMYCKEYKVVLKKLLEIDSLDSFIPNVVIVQSLHQWYDEKTALIKIPMIYAKICSAAVDTTNHIATMTNQECFSFITTDTDEFPTCITELLYEDVIIANPNCMQEIFKKYKKLDEN